MHAAPQSHALGTLGNVLLGALDSVRPPGVAARVLDCGGGSGRLAVPLAVRGARVTVVDVSADALATLRRRAGEAGVASEVIAVQGDVEVLGDLADDVPAESFDLVLAHGILESVDSPTATLRAVAAAMRPGGLLSIVVANPVAAVLARALGGDLESALALLETIGEPTEHDDARDGDHDGDHDDDRDANRASDRRTDRADPVSVGRVCADLGLLTESVHGVDVFRDLVPGHALDAPGARETLARLEAVSAGRSPFTDIASRVHLLARRPGGVAAGAD